MTGITIAPETAQGKRRHAPRGMTPLEKLYFFTPDRPTESAEACWLWQGTVKRPGAKYRHLDPEKWAYGVLRINGRLEMAHRISYLEHIGPIPKGMEVGHTCHRPRCIRPEHLYPTTHAGNMADMAAAGRYGIRPPPYRRGFKLDAATLSKIAKTKQKALLVRGGCGINKLCAADIPDLRAMRASGLKMREIAERFDVHVSTVSRIIKGQRWAHVTEER
jgi:hypothetical protein